jgi:hypothetical protein
VHHSHLGTLDVNTIEAEIAGVEDTLRRPEVLGSGAARPTLFRAPYGEPFQDGSDPMGTVASVVASHAVHIGWAADSNDWQCVGNPDCVFNNVTNLIRTPGNGSYGVILLHAVQPQTADALQRILDYISSNGFVLWQVEDVVRARYGKSSSELIGGSGGGCTPLCTGKQCGDDGCGGSCGSCASGQTCDGSGQCSGGGCTPQCDGMACGDDGCGGSCGSCGDGQTCDDTGQCVDATMRPSPMTARPARRR